jgi:hypothetical protein
VDLNAALPEIAALDWVFSRLDSNFIILFDDFGFLDHEQQKEMIYQFLLKKSLRIQCLPTGQGVVVHVWAPGCRLSPILALLRALPLHGEVCPWADPWLYHAA